MIQQICLTTYVHIWETPTFWSNSYLLKIEKDYFAENKNTFLTKNDDGDLNFKPRKPIDHQNDLHILCLPFELVFENEDAIF